VCTEQHGHSEPRILSNDATGLCLSTGELSSHDETNTAEMIDQMFEEVLEYADRMEEEDRRGDEDMDDRDKDKMHPESEKERRGEDDVLLKEEEEEEEEEKKEEEDESKEVDASEEDELLTFPPSGILSPLSKSVEAVVTPLVRATPISLKLMATKEEGIIRTVRLVQYK